MHTQTFGLKHVEHFVFRVTPDAALADKKKTYGHFQFILVLKRAQKRKLAASMVIRNAWTESVRKWQCHGCFNSKVIHTFVFSLSYVRVLCFMMFALTHHVSQF